MRYSTVAAVVALLALVSCGPNSCSSDDTQGPIPAGDSVYSDEAGCVAAGNTADACHAAFAAAQQQHEATAPHYAAQASCEDVYGPGNCVPRGSGGDSFFMPYMMGYMMGGGGYDRTVVVSRPVYIDRSGSFYSSGARISTPPSVGSRGGFGASSSIAPSYSAPRSAISPSVVARGGFGSMAAAVGDSAGG